MIDDVKLLSCKFLYSFIILCLECLPMAWETGVQSRVKSYQRLKKLYLMLPGL